MFLELKYQKFRIKRGKKKKKKVAKGLSAWALKNWMVWLGAISEHRRAETRPKSRVEGEAEGWGKELFFSGISCGYGSQ